MFKRKHSKLTVSNQTSEGCNSTMFKRKLVIEKDMQSRFFCCNSTMFKRKQMGTELIEADGSKVATQPCSSENDGVGLMIDEHLPVATQPCSSENTWVKVIEEYLDNPVATQPCSSENYCLRRAKPLPRNSCNSIMFKRKRDGYRYSRG